MKIQIAKQVGGLVENWSRKRFFALFIGLLLLLGALSLHWPWFSLGYLVAVPLFLFGWHDATQKRHTILRNFPLLGRIRYMLEALRPEIRQYFVESDRENTPYSREKRSVIFQRAKGQLDTRPFGTIADVNAIGYEWLNHSLSPKHPESSAGRFVVGGPDCKQPYSCSVLNVSAMSFGALSKNAVLALNAGAKQGDFAHNTGEGSISPYHLEPGGDLIWQIGTGYFGCRKEDGTFDPELFAQRARGESVKMVELKLSQGAKPAHGGILPAAKITPEIAKIRHVPLAQDVNSPPAHSAFSTPVGLLEFVARLRKLSGGKPVGFKLCVGRPEEWFAIVKAMTETGITPDFITVDGGEGGTGAAPLEFSNSVGMPLADGLALVHGSLVGVGLRDRLRIIAAGKVSTGFHILHKMALGADGCNAARAMMFALGCIQALKCNTNKCPTGVATSDPELFYGLDPDLKAGRVASYHEKTVASFVELLGAGGMMAAAECGPDRILRRTAPGEIRSLEQIYPSFTPGGLTSGQCPEQYQEAWARSTAATF